MTLYGFSLIRNGLKYDYPFVEALQSIAPMVERISLALGDSDDGTEDRIKSLDLPIDIVPTVWDENSRKSGLILSQQTNIALEALRERFHGAGDWGFYIQGDEAVHEDDHELILSDIKKAQDEGYDAVRFRYLHFWTSYHQFAINWWWYPSEIRAIKLASDIESFGDAQGFQNARKVYESEARIFHYGHVREEAAYKKKTIEFHRWWHADDKTINKAEKKSQKRARQTRTLFYYGPHPKPMEKRMGGFSYPILKEVGLVGHPGNYSDQFINSIRAEKVYWAHSLDELKEKHPGNYPRVILEGTWWENFRSKTKVPTKMESELARPWSKDFIATLKLSLMGIPMGNGPAIQPGKAP